MAKKSGKKTGKKSFKTKQTAVMKIPKPFMKNPTYYFKRKLEHIFNPAATDGRAPWTATTDGGVVYSHNIKLYDLPNYDDFISLFDTYKVLGVEFEVRCAANSVVASNRGAEGASTLMLRVAPNSDCKLLTAANTRNAWLSKQDVKRYIFPNNYDRPLRIYEPCKIKNELVGSFPSISKPKWIPTENYNNVNYTVDMRLDAVSGEYLVNNKDGIPSFTIVETVYLAFKSVI